VPRTCVACSSSDRAAIDEALVAGEPLRNIAKRVSISPTALLRHKNHVSQSVVKAAVRRDEQLGDSLLGQMRRVHHKVLARMESEGDHRGSIVALREVRECLESLGTMLDRAGGLDAPRVTLAQVLEARRKAGLASYNRNRSDEMDKKS
jgi:hypothetical protein